MRRILIALSLLATPWAASLGQGSAVIYRSSWADVAAVTVTGTAALFPTLLKLPKGAPSCAPCSPSGLPGIDRGVLGANSSFARAGSNVLLIGVGGLAVYAAMHDRPSLESRGNLAVLANSVSWTAASTNWLKVLFHRKRPVLYTSGAVAASSDVDNQRSFPSGHASVGFAIATSYLVMANREHLPHRSRNALLLYSGAAAVSGLRVAGGKHFPTDVIAGAALGTAIGWLVATVHPKAP